MSLALSAADAAGQDTRANLSFVWLEITGKCQLECEHCYAESGPKGEHGTMTPDDWKRVIGQAAELGVTMVQFIGGEPTQHPHLVELARYALALGVEVEIYTNLVTVSPAQWELFGEPGVCVATSYYTGDPDEHAKITHGARGHILTTANIAEAVRRDIPLRVGVIDVLDGQLIQEAYDILHELGVTYIDYDFMRGVGRGVRGGKEGIDQLCGKCTQGKLAISPDGIVWPCVFSRWLPMGNVRLNSLAELLASRKLAATRAVLDEHFSQRTEPAVPHGRGEFPRPGDPEPCDPDIRCDPTGHCRPKRSVGAQVARMPACPPMVGCGPNCKPNCRPNCEPAIPGYVNRAASPAKVLTASAPGRIAEPCLPDERCVPRCGPSCTPPPPLPAS